MSLLQKAQLQSITHNKTKIIVTYEHAELIDAFLKGELSTRDVSNALDFSSAGSATHLATRIIKESMKKGWLEVKLIKPPTE